MSFQDVTVLPPIPPRNTTTIPITYIDVQGGEGVSEEEKGHKSTYYAYFLAFGNNVCGNVPLKSSIQTLPQFFQGMLRLSQASSRILQTGLVAYDEIADDYWARTKTVDITGIFTS